MRREATKNFAESVHDRLLVIEHVVLLLHQQWTTEPFLQHQHQDKVQLTLEELVEVRHPPGLLRTMQEADTISHNATIGNCNEGEGEDQLQRSDQEVNLDHALEQMTNAIATLSEADGGQTQELHDDSVQRTKTALYFSLV